MVISVVLVGALGAAVALAGPHLSARTLVQQRGVVVRGNADPGEPAVLRVVTELVQRLPQALASGDSGPLARGARSSGADLRAALPPGTTLTLDPATWRRTGTVGSATVTAAVPDRPPAAYVVVMVLEGTSWRISGTYPVPSQAR